MAGQTQLSADKQMAADKDCVHCAHPLVRTSGYDRTLVPRDDSHNPVHFCLHLLKTPMFLSNVKDLKSSLLCGSGLPSPEKTVTRDWQKRVPGELGRWTTEKHPNCPASQTLAWSNGSSLGPKRDSSVHSPNFWDISFLKHFFKCFQIHFSRLLQIQVPSSSHQIKIHFHSLESWRRTKLFTLSPNI